jgi:hypothetical protein
MGIAALSRYSPWIVFLIGICAFLSCLGTGLLIQRVFRWKLPTPWKQVTALCIGVEVLCLAVEAVGMAGVAIPRVLLGIALMIAVMGIAGLWLDRDSLRIAAVHRPKPWPAIWALPSVAIAILLLIALAPSSKNDEIYYHMLIPARLVGDHALHFYRQPLEGAITPQMGYQIGTAPLYVLGYPDACNVLSVCIAAMIAWFTYQVVIRRSSNGTWAVVAGTVPLIGMSATTLYSAAGPHALGDLGCVAVMVAVIELESLSATIAPISLIAMLSILGTAGAMTKLPFLPITLLAVIYAATKILRAADGRVSKSLGMLAGAFPWILIFSPLICWTWAASGSPFGPLFTSLFPSSIYDRSLIHQLLAESRAFNRMTAKEALLSLVLHYSFALWIGVALFFTSAFISPIARRRGAILLVIQAILVAVLLPQSVRFLAAIPLALFILFAAQVNTERAFAWPLRLATILLIFPSLAVGAYYARQFLPALRGGASRDQFIADKIPLITDYRALDRLLPADAVLLLRDEIRIDGYYSPRSLVLDPADIPAGRPVYHMQLQGAGVGPPRFPLTAYQAADVIYHNSVARIQTFRSPGRPPLMGDLQVVRLIWLPLLNR